MLVFSLAKNEGVVVGDDTVLAVQGNKVRLGISAPTGISVWRGELVLDGAVKHSSWPSKAHQATAP